MQPIPDESSSYGERLAHKLGMLLAEQEAAIDSIHGQLSTLDEVKKEMFSLLVEVDWPEVQCKNKIPKI